MADELSLGKGKNKPYIDFSKIRSGIKREDLLKGVDPKMRSVFEQILDQIDTNPDDKMLSRSELEAFFKTVNDLAKGKGREKDDKTNLSNGEAKKFQIDNLKKPGKTKGIGKGKGKDALFLLLNKLTELSKDVKITKNGDGSETNTYPDGTVEQVFPNGKIIRTEKNGAKTTVTTTENGVETDREETTEIGDWTQKTTYEKGKKTKQVTTSNGTTYEINYDSEENPTTQVVTQQSGEKREYKYNEEYPNSWEPVETTEDENSTTPRYVVVQDDSQSTESPTAEKVVKQNVPKNQDAENDVLEQVDLIEGGTRTTVTELNNGESFYETVTEEVDGKTTLVQEYEYKKDENGNSKRCLASETDANGNVIYYTNDKHGNRVKSVETKGATEIITEYENNKPKLVKEIDHQNHTVKNTSYNADGSKVVAEYSGVTVEADENGEYKLKADSKESYSEKLTEYDSKGQPVVAAPKAKPVVKRVSVNPQREAMLQDEASRKMVKNYEVFAGDPLAKCNSAYQIAEVLFMKEGRTQITREEYERRAKQIMADNPGMFTEKGMRKFYSKEMSNTIVGCKLNLRMQQDVAYEYDREHNRINDIRTMGKEASSARKEGDLATALFRTKASGKEKTNIYKDVISKINSGNVVAFLKSVEANDKDTGNAFGFINKAFSNETIKKDFLDKVRTALVARAKELNIPQSEIKKLNCINISNINDTKTMNAVVKTILSLLETVQNTAPSERSAVIRSIANKNAAPNVDTLSAIAKENMDEANEIVDNQVKDGTWTEKLFDKLWVGEHCSTYTKNRINQLKTRMDKVRVDSLDKDGKLDEVLFKENFAKEFGTDYNSSLMNAYKEVQQQLTARLAYEDFSKNFATNAIAQLDEEALRAKLVKYFGGEDCKKPDVKQMIEDFKTANKEELLAFVECWQEGLAENAPYKDCVTLANELKDMNRQVFGVNVDVIGDANEFVKVIQRGGMATQAVIDIASIMLSGGVIGWASKGLSNLNKIAKFSRAVGYTEKAAVLTRAANNAERIATISKTASLTTAAVMPSVHETVNSSLYADAHVGDLVYEFDKNGNPIIDKKTGLQKTHQKTWKEAFAERANYTQAAISGVENALLMAVAMGNAERILSQVADGSLTKVEAFTALLGFDFTTAIEMGLIHGDGHMSEEEFINTLAMVVAGEGMMLGSMRGTSSKASKTTQNSTPVSDNPNAAADVLLEQRPLSSTAEKATVGGTEDVHIGASKANKVINEYKEGVASATPEDMAQARNVAQNLSGRTGKTKTVTTKNGKNKGKTREVVVEKGEKIRQEATRNLDEAAKKNLEEGRWTQEQYDDKENAIKAADKILEGTHKGMNPSDARRVRDSFEYRTAEELKSIIDKLEPRKGIYQQGVDHVAELIKDAKALLRQKTAANADLESLIADLDNCIASNRGLNENVSAKLKEVLPKLTEDADIQAFLAKWKEIKNPSKSDKSFVRKTLESKGYKKDASGNYVKKGSAKPTEKPASPAEEAQGSKPFEEAASKAEGETKQTNANNVNHAQAPKSFDELSQFIESLDKEGLTKQVDNIIDTYLNEGTPYHGQEHYDFLIELLHSKGMNEQIGRLHKYGFKHSSNTELQGIGQRMRPSAEDPVERQQKTSKTEERTQKENVINDDEIEVIDVKMDNNIEEKPTPEKIDNYIDENPTPEATLIRNKIREQIEKDFWAETTNLKNTLGKNTRGEDFYNNLKWENIIPKDASPQEIQAILRDLNTKAKSFTQVFALAEQYGRNFDWAQNVLEIQKNAVNLMREGKSAFEVTEQIADGYGRLDKSGTDQARAEYSGQYRPDYVPDAYPTTPSFKNGKYGAYYDRFMNILRSNQEIPAPYEDAPMTRLKLEKRVNKRTKKLEDVAVMHHPIGKDVPIAMKHVETLYDKLKPIIEKVQSGGKLTKADFDLVYDIVPEIDYVLSHAMPWARGSNGIVDTYIRAIYKSLGLNMPTLKPNVGLDLEAFCTDLPTFKRNWREQKFFESTAVTLEDGAGIAKTGTPHAGSRTESAPIVTESELANRTFASEAELDAFMAGYEKQVVGDGAKRKYVYFEGSGEKFEFVKTPDGKLKLKSDVEASSAPRQVDAPRNSESATNPTESQNFDLNKEFPQTLTKEQARVWAEQNNVNIEIADLPNGDLLIVFRNEKGMPTGSASYDSSTGNFKHGTEKVWSVDGKFVAETEIRPDGSKTYWINIKGGRGEVSPEVYAKYVEEVKAGRKDYLTGDELTQRRYEAEAPKDAVRPDAEVGSAPRPITESELANRTFASEAELDAFMAGYEKQVVGDGAKRKYVYFEGSGEKFEFVKTPDGKLKLKSDVEASSVKFDDMYLQAEKLDAANIFNFIKNNKSSFQTSKTNIIKGNGDVSFVKNGTKYQMHYEDGKLSALRVADANGNKTYFAYDKNGQRVQISKEDFLKLKTSSEAKWQNALDELNSEKSNGSRAEAKATDSEPKAEGSRNSQANSTEQKPYTQMNDEELFAEYYNLRNQMEYSSLNRTEQASIIKKMNEITKLLGDKGFEVRMENGSPVKVKKGGKAESRQASSEQYNTRLEDRNPAELTDDELYATLDRYRTKTQEKTADGEYRLRGGYQSRYNELKAEFQRRGLKFDDFLAAKNAQRATGLSSDYVLKKFGSEMHRLWSRGNDLVKKVVDVKTYKNALSWIKSNIKKPEVLNDLMMKLERQWANVKLMRKPADLYTGSKVFDKKALNDFVNEPMNKSAGSIVEEMSKGFELLDENGKPYPKGTVVGIGDLSTYTGKIHFMDPKTGMKYVYGFDNGRMVGREHISPNGETMSYATYGRTGKPIVLIRNKNGIVFDKSFTEIKSEQFNPRHGMTDGGVRWTDYTINNTSEIADAVGVHLEKLPKNIQDEVLAALRKGEDYSVVLGDKKYAFQIENNRIRVSEFDIPRTAGNSNGTGYTNTRGKMNSTNFANEAELKKVISKKFSNETQNYIINNLRNGKAFRLQKAGVEYHFSTKNGKMVMDEFNIQQKYNIHTRKIDNSTTETTYEVSSNEDIAWAITDKRRLFSQQTQTKIINALKNNQTFVCEKYGIKFEFSIDAHGKITIKETKLVRSSSSGNRANGERQQAGRNSDMSAAAKQERINVIESIIERSESIKAFKDKLSDILGDGFKYTNEMDMKKFHKKCTLLKAFWHTDKGGNPPAELQMLCDDLNNMSDGKYVVAGQARYGTAEEINQTLDNIRSLLDIDALKVELASLKS